MPHCIVEYSRGIENLISSEKLVGIVNSGALKSELFRETDIKTRALVYDHYMLGSCCEQFIHVTLKILSGRNLEQKRKLTGSVMCELRKEKFSSVSLTVEVYDIDRDTYSKDTVIKNSI